MPGIVLEDGADAPGPPGFKPLEAQLARLSRIIRRQVHLVRAEDEAAFGVYMVRQHERIVEIRPFVTPVTGHREQPVPVRGARAPCRP